MRVTLLHTPYYHQDHMENLSVTSNNFAVLPPMGLLYVSSIVQNEGHEVQVIDVKAEKVSMEQVFERIDEFDPDIIGGLIIPYTAKIALKWYEEISENFDAPIMVGNHAMKQYPEAVMSNEFIDYGITGSALESVPKLLEKLENGEKDLDDVPNLAYRKDGELRINLPEKNVENLNKLPWPDRESINNDLYFSMASKKKPFTLLITSYGCMFHCDFCDMGSFGYSEREPEDVVDEIEYCVNDLGIEEIDIFDRDFLINKERSMEICDRIIERELEFRWTCRTRVDQVDRETLEKMYEAGCRLIMYGIESGNQDILDREHKGITIQQAEEAVHTTKNVGIQVLGFFIIGHSGETVDKIKNTIEFAKKLPLDYAQFFKLSGKPGAKLYEDIVEELGYDYFDKLIRQEIEVHKLPRPWTEMSNEELESWVSKAYNQFYLRPSYMVRRASQIRSLHEFEKLAKVGVKMVFTTMKKILKGVKS